MIDEQSETPDPIALAAKLARGDHDDRDCRMAAAIIRDLKSALAAMTKERDEANEGEEIAVPLCEYNELSMNILALDAEWRELLIAVEQSRRLAEGECERLRLLMENQNVNE